MIQNEYINLAIDYILKHINENISVDEIASHCNFSRYYFSRMFKMETGESIHQFIMRVRMEQSAFRLKVENGKSITDVGEDYGYSSSNYSSAFKQHLSLSPVEFRRNIKEKSLKNPIYHNTNVDFNTFETVDKKITIQCLNDFTVIFERHKGSYLDLSKNWDAFMKKYSSYITVQTLFIDRTYDDPSITNVSDCLYDLCMTIPDGYSSDNTYVITGGKFAIYHFKNHVKDIYSAYQNIFNVWLPQCPYKIDDRYGFEIYRKINCDSMFMEIDIYIPIK